MVEVMKSSFIPKKEIKKTVERKKGAGVSLFFLISLILFLSMVVSGIGMYLYRTSLVKKIKLKEAEIKVNAEAYSITAFQEFIDNDKRIKVADEILKNHYAISPIFTFLEQNTIATVLFTNAKIFKEGDKIKCEFSGRATEFSDLVRQKDLYTKNANINDFLFYNITRSKEKGDVIFDMSFNIDKK